MFRALLRGPASRPDLEMGKGCPSRSIPEEGFVGPQTIYVLHWVNTVFSLNFHNMFFGDLETVFPI